MSRAADKTTSGPPSAPAPGPFPSSAALPLWRTRLAVALVSMAVIGLQLTLMRTLALQLWGHLAYLVIGVALLGFGASGTALTLLRNRVSTNPRAWLTSLIMLLGLSILLAPRAAQLVPVNIRFLAWDLSQIGGIFALELMILVPFLLAGAAIGVVLMDRAERLGGHYAANLFGSGLGAMGAVLAMHVLTTGSLLTVLAAVTLCAAGIVGPPARRFRTALAAAAAIAVLILTACPWHPSISEFKSLPQFMDMPGSEILHRVEGPLGRLDVVDGPAVRHAPGLSLGYLQEIPSHVLILVDGDVASAVYDCRDTDDWRFMDHTTGAAGYHLLSAAPAALVIGAGGGGEIGLALYHEARQVVALEMNGQFIDLVAGPLRARGGEIFHHERVSVIPAEARGFLSGSGPAYDLIQLPTLDAFGATGAGLHAAQESYLYTVESFGEMLDRLAPGGLLSITRWARTPPRDELRVLATAAEALSRRGREPAAHLAMIRSWATVTVLAGRRPLDSRQTDALRDFCDTRGFDLCFIPGLERDEANRFHRLEDPIYFDAAAALLGPDRSAFIDRYLFDIAPATDDRPYFFRSLRWSSLAELGRRFGAHSRAYLELGSLMSAAALLQGIVVGFVLILLPLALRRRGLSGVRRLFPVLVYFLMLGTGFMLLEIGFLQKLILYLAHPIYSAATVIAAFLVFSGLGSLTATASSIPRRRSIALLALAVVALGSIYALVFDDWLALSRSRPLALRLAIAAATIAPLAFFMGKLFPAGMAVVSRDRTALVPWAWAANGFASVTATVACPLIAAELGFGAVLLLAVGCYLLAGLVSRRLT
jgi:spermidine synthase